MRNVGEPVDLQVIRDHKKTSIPGFILNLSAGGMKIVTLGDQAAELTIGTHFVLDLQMHHIHPFHLEGQIISIQKGEKAKLHHTGGEWLLGLSFTKISSADSHEITRMANDWNICESKMQLNLPDICFKECCCWDFCEKTVKLVEK